MAAPPFIKTALALRNGVPNNADVAGETSMAIARAMCESLGVSRTMEPKEDSGKLLEVGVMEYLEEALPLRASARLWEVSRRKSVWDFAQYEHLRRVDEIIREHPTLRTQIGQDYHIKPDVTVGISVDSEEQPLLHAAISCKWTIRSDRVQNIRHEGVILTRSRRGRQPHIVTVTAEPLPTRLASIARGTGEVDAVYHAALEELLSATLAEGTAEQKEVLEELVSQNRLIDFERLVDVLAV